ncbi:MAG: metal ABC transporter permease, partial [Caryophanon sp.]|nr:metal ABC transporter permease [Caryophanon sp.]
MIEAIFNYEFLQNAFFSGLIIGVIAPLLGVFIVVRRLSLIADALSHVTLAGIAGSLYLSQSVPALALLNPIYLGILASVSGSILIERLRSLYKHYEELAIPIIMSGGIGLSAIFISMAQGFNQDLMSYLFGSVSAVSRQDLYVVIGIAVVVIVFLFFMFKELFLLSFDDEFAKASGIPAKWVHLAFMI